MRGGAYSGDHVVRQWSVWAGRKREVRASPVQDILGNDDVMADLLTLVARRGDGEPLCPCFVHVCRTHDAHARRWCSRGSRLTVGAGPISGRLSARMVLMLLRSVVSRLQDIVARIDHRFEM